MAAFFDSAVDDVLEILGVDIADEVMVALIHAIGSMPGYEYEARRRSHPQKVLTIGALTARLLMDAGAASNFTR